MSTLIEKARTFATQKHTHQKRKFNGEPYVNHCIRVSQTVSEFTDNTTLIVAALLHDTLEDTDTTFEELSSEFGIDVATIVFHLTNNSEIMAVKGKTAYLADKIPSLTKDELLIKLADRLDNLTDLRWDDKWSSGYASQTKTVFFDSLGVEGLQQPHLILMSRISQRIAMYV